MKTLGMSIAVVLILFFWFRTTENIEVKTESKDQNNLTEREKTAASAGTSQDNEKKDDKVKESGKRITVEKLSEEELNKRREQTRQELFEVIPELQFQGNLTDIIAELNSMTSLKVEYLSSTTPGVSCDENFPPGNPDIKLALDFENMPFRELI